jgi:hypothetical protein
MRAHKLVRMSAPPRITTQDIVNALLRWRSVAGAARELGIRRNNLYARAQRLGLDLNGLRTSAPSVTSITGVPPMPPMARMPPNSGAVPPMTRIEHVSSSDRKNAAAPYPSGPVGRRLVGMQTAAATVDEIAQRKKGAKASVLPAQAALLSDAKYDFQHVLRTDIDETKILELFIADEFERWKKKTLERLEAERASGAEPQPTKRANGGGEKGRGSK